MGVAAFFPAAVALAGGMIAQVVAARLAVPSIVLLLGTGILLGPDALGILDPTVFGVARRDLVNLAVTVILFEGGLALDVGRLRQQQRALLMLLTVGAAISMTAGMVGARILLDMPWSLATLYGALMIVTGPTVVTPLLSRLTVNRSVRELLIGEGVLIDPLGAIVAIVAAEYVVGDQRALASGWLVFVRLVIGGCAGFAGGLLLAVALRRRWIPEELRNPLVLGVVLIVAAGASHASAEAGLMAAVVQGVVLANAGLRELRRLREFKEALTVILLSFIFVVLAADLRLDKIWQLGWQSAAVVAILVWIARPLAVFASTIGSTLTVRERAFVAWICPRGIVAAAVAGLFRLQLEQAGVAGGHRLEALVFVTVALTVCVQGFTAGPIARLLRVDAVSLTGTIVIGADRFARLLSRLLLTLGRQVAVVDRSTHLCRIARSEGFSVVEGDALSIDTLEDAGARYADTVVAMTRNPELNALVAQRVRDNFRVDRVLAVTEEPDTDGSEDSSRVFPGDFPGIDDVNRLLRVGQLAIIAYTLPGADAPSLRLGTLPFGDGEFALLVQRRRSVFMATSDRTIERGDVLWCLKPPRVESHLARLLTPVETAAPAGRPSKTPVSG